MGLAVWLVPATEEPVPAVLVASVDDEPVVAGVAVASAPEGLVAESVAELVPEAIVLHSENTSLSYVSVVSGQYLERHLHLIRNPI